MPNFQLYRDAVAADQAFTVELERVYGKKACDLRYQQASHADPAVEAAKVAKLAADKAWREEMSGKVES